MGDIAVAVGCCIGVGFLSGKEAQVFFGNIFNVIIFAVAFFVANYTLREYCRLNECSTVGKLSDSLFARGATFFNTGIALSSFVCIVTVLAGVEQCLSSMFYLSKLPLYAFAASVLACLLLGRDMKAMKYANALSVVMAIVLIIILSVTNKAEHVDDLQVPMYQPIKYALFSVTMSLGVTTKLATDSSKSRNIIASVLASVITATLMAVVLPLCNVSADFPALSNISHPMLLFFAIITLLLSAVTGIVANAYPVVQQIKSLVPDTTIRNALMFGVALAFSMFGFDFAVKIGYLIVSIFGAVIVLLTICKLIKNKDKVIVSHSIP